MHISSGMLVVRQHGEKREVLLMYRKKTNSWHLPKGTRVGEESILETALREVKEETGSDVLVERYLGRLLSRKANSSPKLTHYYLAHPATFAGSRHDVEHDAVAFVPFFKARRLLRQKSLFEKEYQVLDWLGKFEAPKVSRPIVIFDLDHTLFDTARFKTDMFSSLQRYNIPQKVVARAYNDLMNKKGEFLYDYHLEDHLRLLRGTFRFAVEAGKKRFLKVFSRSHQYLFPGVTKLLSHLKIRGCELVLLTRGNREFNLRKVRKSGLNKHFDRVIADHRDKIWSLARILEKHGLAETWFIGDSVEELKEASRLYPEVNCVLKLRDDKDQPGKENFVQIGEIRDLRKLLI